MNLGYLAVLTASIFCLSTTVSAQSNQNSSVSFGFSTFGARLEGAYRFLPDWRMRGAITGSNYLVSETYNGTEFNVDAGFNSLSVLADYYPTSSGWRLSGGILVNNSSGHAIATASNTNKIEINGEKYTSGTVTVDAKFHIKVSPVVTTGYDYRFAKNWTLSGETGAVYTGGIDLKSTGGTADLQTAIDGSADFKNAKKKASEKTIYPYISVSLSFSF